MSTTSPYPFSSEFIGHLQKSTSFQFEASQYRESDPNPASPPSIDPPKDCSHSRRCQSIKDFESFQNRLILFLLLLLDRDCTVFSPASNLLSPANFVPFSVATWCPSFSPLWATWPHTVRDKHTQTQILVSKWVHCEPLDSTTSEQQRRKGLHCILMHTNANTQIQAQSQIQIRISKWQYIGPSRSTAKSKGVATLITGYPLHWPTNT